MELHVPSNLGRLKMLMVLLILAICLSDAPPPPRPSVQARSGYLPSGYSHRFPPPPPRAVLTKYLPPPQYCPETGRTVCKDVPYYPEEQIYMILRKSRAYGFNLSSLFVDEREGDAEPNTEQLPDWPSFIPYDHAYLLYRPTVVHHDYNAPNVSPWANGWSKRPAGTVYSKGRKCFGPADRVTVAPRNFKRRQNQEIEAACTSQLLFIPPRAALNDKSQWKYVVNVPNLNARYKQIIRVEVCESPDRPCRSQISLPFGYTSRCTQKHIKKKLLSLDPDGQSTSEDSFFVPSCCVCEIVRN